MIEGQCEVTWSVIDRRNHKIYKHHADEVRSLKKANHYKTILSMLIKSFKSHIAN